MKDPYAALGVTRGADADVIKAAYHSLLKKYHPDKAGKDPAAIEKFFEIRAAWECLSDSHRRDPVDRDAPGPDAANPHSTPHPKKPPTRSAFGPSSAESPGETRSADRASTPAAYSLLDSLRDGAVALVIYGVYGVGGVVFALLALVLFG
jgi:curved DNA-binding protein CbpA